IDIGGNSWAPEEHCDIVDIREKTTLLRVVFLFVNFDIGKKRNRNEENCRFISSQWFNKLGGS
ncbi:hypothetical protein, partial [Bacillus toyonensis]|uniref:hypothetical protein n=1 Tax=Bacillus toyonensis TaxID=155322 RepID=UPI001C3F4A56